MYTLRTTQFLTVLFCLHLADPANFLASDSILGNSLFIQVWKRQMFLMFLN